VVLGELYCSSYLPLSVTKARLTVWLSGLFCAGVKAAKTLTPLRFLHGSGYLFMYHFAKDLQWHFVGCNGAGHNIIGAGPV
jgi:hypothetical protein